MQCILVKSDEFENSSHLIYFSSILIVRVAARSLWSLRSKNKHNKFCWSVTLLMFIQTLDHISHCKSENRLAV